MPKTLYSPKLSDDVVRRLYREGQRRKLPMTVLADELLREALADIPPLESVSMVAECPHDRQRWIPGDEAA